MLSGAQIFSLGPLPNFPDMSGKIDGYRLLTKRNAYK
jgi:hypothetical protein